MGVALDTSTSYRRLQRKKNHFKRLQSACVRISSDEDGGMGDDADAFSLLKNMQHFASLEEECLFGLAFFG